MKLLVSFLLSAMLASCVAGSNPPIQGRPVPLVPEGKAMSVLGPLRYAGGVVITAGEPGFGGLSGMVVDQDHRTLTMVSDRGRWFRTRMVLDGAGRLTGLDGLAGGPLHGPDGRVLSGRMTDSEELAAIPGGGWLVTFERIHRLWRYADLSGAPQPVVLPPEVQGLPENGGLEAMAALPDGRLLLVAEDGAADHSVAWLGGPGAWIAFQVKLMDDFRPSGLALLPDGGMVMIQRRFGLLSGFSVRLVRFSPEEIRQGGAIAGQELLRFDPPLTSDNFEAVAVSGPTAGQVRLLLLSDDNFNPLQSTLLLAFDLTL